MNKIRTAYFAGIIDGEGSIGMTSNGKNKPKKFTVEVKMTCLKTVSAIHKHFGVGHILTRPSKNPSWKNQWRWRVSGQPARLVIEKIKPFLI